jgi:hypothetical protein
MSEKRSMMLIVSARSESKFQNLLFAGIKAFHYETKWGTTLTAAASHYFQKQEYWD